METIRKSTKLEQLPMYLQKPLWAQYKGTNYANFAEATMRSLISSGYVRAAQYVNRKVRKFS